MDGEGAAKYIRSTNSKNTNVPIIAVSAYSGSDPSELPSNLFSGSLAKPLQKADLVGECASCTSFYRHRTDINSSVDATTWLQDLYYFQWPRCEDNRRENCFLMTYIRSHVDTTRPYFRSDFHSVLPVSFAICQTCSLSPHILQCIFPTQL